MAFRATNRKNLYLKRKGHESEWEPARLRRLGDFLVSMGLLSEASRLPDTFFAELNQAIADSKFWAQENDFQWAEFNTVDPGISVEQTDAAAVLGDAIRWFFKDQGFPIIIAVQSIDPEPNRAKLQLPVGKGHRVYPNGLVMGGMQAIDKGRFVMYLHLAPTDSTFDPDDVNPSVIAANIGRKIRHEIVHTQQFEKRRRRGKISRQAAKERYEAEGDIPPEDAPRPQYLGSGMEIDAYAHEFAEELLDLFGKNKALDIIRRNPSPGEFKALGLSDTLIEYLEEYGRASFTRRLLEKIYTQIMDMVSRGLYENLLREYVHESLRCSELTVRPSSIHGLGVFAADVIPVDTDLGAAQIRRLDSSYDVTKLGRYHNHSSEPTCYNVWVGNERHLFPCRDLELGEEITIDYTKQADLEQPKMGWS